MDSTQRKISLTSFNFQLPEDHEDNEGVLSKIFDKVKYVVSGQLNHQDNISVHNSSSSQSSLQQQQQPTAITLHQRKPSSISSSIHSNNLPSFAIINEQQKILPVSSSSTNSSLCKHLTTPPTTSSTVSSSSSITNFPVSMHLDTVPRLSTSTTATTTTTVTVGNQKPEKEVLPQQSVQFMVPTPSTHSRKSQDELNNTLDYLLNNPLNKRRSIDSDTQSVVTNFSISNSNSLSRMLARLRGQKGDKEFWMPDEQCKECYKCRKPFTLLRRKHHCRICGQIFCGKCASHIITGKQYKQKGQVRVCNFCYAEQIQQHKDNTPNATATPPNIFPLSKQHLSATNAATNNNTASANSNNKNNNNHIQQNDHHSDSLQLPENEPQEDSTTSQHYPSSIIPLQKPPLAIPRMQIPTTALKQTRSTYGNDNTTTFALEIPTHASESYLGNGSPQTSFLMERPYSSSVMYHETSLDSPAIAFSPYYGSTPEAFASGNTAMAPMFTTTATNTNTSFVVNNETNGLKRLFDVGTSLLKSSTRPRSNTSSSAPMEDTRYATQAALLFNGYPYLDRGGGTVLSESELSPFPGNDLYQSTAMEYIQQQQQQHQSLQQQPSPTLLHQPPPFRPTITTTPPPINSMLASAGSDDESYDHTLRVKRTEELRGKSLSSRNSFRRLSLSGNHSPTTSVVSNNRLLRNSSRPRINSFCGLPRLDYDGKNSPILSSYIENNEEVSEQQSFSVTTPSPTTTIRLRLPPPVRPRRSFGHPQTIELSQSARSHARAILGQLMKDVQLEKSKKDWEDVIMNILLKVATYVQPDIRAGDDMDVRHYVKIKKIPGGIPSDSFYIKGVMCTKNVAHKRMIRNIAHPRILILMFSLDYSRVEMENQLLSIAPVISQEREHIRKLVNRIVALRPSLLIVKSTVSRLALEFLLEANIPVVHNVKHSVIEAIARCTQASVVTSVDKLQYGISFGRCGSFKIKTLVHEWIPNRRKTFLMFDDCDPVLGGTIVLRGENMETLSVIKRLIDFMVFVVNNLKLETSLLLDSFAKSRDLPEPLETAAVTERNRSPLISLATSLDAKYEDGDEDEESSHPLFQSVHNNYIANLLNLYQDTILSVSQFVVFPPPYLLLTLKDTEEKLAMINQQKRKMSISGSSIVTNGTSITGSNARNSIISSCNASIAPVVSLSGSPTKSAFDKHLFDHHYNHSNPGYDEDLEHDLISKYHKISKAWDAYIGENPESISPFYHQNIVVLYSSVCTATTVPCQGPEIRIFSFYRFPSDKTLGQYIMDFCNDARQPCSSFMCDHPILRHYRSYAHGNARVNVMIEPFPCPLPGLSDKLLMWSYCKECKKYTSVLPMSENTWNYSFGKFLEVFLYQKEVHFRTDICPHDMHRNHVRYFGYMDLTVRFQYDPIDLLEVSSPPMKLFIQSQVQKDLKDAELKTLRSKINKFYQSIIERNKAFPFDLVDPRRLEACKSELQDMSLEAQGEKKDALQLVQNLYANSDPTDTLTISVVHRNLFQVVTHWEAIYIDFVRYYLQPERELKKITTDQFKKMFPGEDSSFLNRNNDERTKRAAEVTDLPLLGIGLDGEDTDSLIGPATNLRRKSTTGGDFKTSTDLTMVFPVLSCSPSSSTFSQQEEEDQYMLKDAADSNEAVQATHADHKISFLLPDTRRRLSLKLIHELNKKFKPEDTTTTGIHSLNHMTSNKYMYVKSPGALSVAFTPSRIPVRYYSNNTSRASSASGTPSIYHVGSKHSNTFDKGKKQQSLPIAIGNKSKSTSSHYASKTPVGTVSSFADHRSQHYHSRHHSMVGHSHHQQPVQIRATNIVKGSSHLTEDEDNGCENVGFLRRSSTTRATDRCFRSRLPRKKTHIQVYTQANDLVLEDIDDEFGPGGADDTLSIASSKQQHHNMIQYPLQHDFRTSRRRRGNSDYFGQLALNRHLPHYHVHDNGVDADNDDDGLSNDSSNDSGDDNDGIDYFSSMAPFASEVLDNPSTVAAIASSLNENLTQYQQSIIKGIAADDSDSTTPTSASQLALSNSDKYLAPYPSSKAYFPFSDGHMDLSSGVSGDDDDERDLPSASELLMVKRSSSNSAIKIQDLPNINPNSLDTHVLHNSVNKLITEENLMEENSRHSSSTAAAAEKSSFMKTLTNFLTDGGVGNLLPLESPLQPTEYLFPDSYVVVREDEPSTIIAYTLSSEEYLDKMHDIHECDNNSHNDSSNSDNGSNNGTVKPGDVSIKASSELTILDHHMASTNTINQNTATVQSVDDIQETLLRESGTHMRYNFSTGSTKFFCKIFFSEQFDALRRNCGCDESYIMSLASCVKWDSLGGKSGSAFLKTKDDRFLMKQMSKYELDAFLGFAPAYFQYMSAAFFSELPTVLAKIFGFYSIGYKNSTTGKSMRMDVLVMENLFYQRNVKKIFDLKGSMRNRHVQSTGKQDEVLLDENLVELIYQSPLFIRTHSKEILRSSLHNDTLFLSNRNVMDYSLLVGIDEERQELVVGIVDFIRTFTWDKKLESWVKESGILGGGGKGPTIVSPRQYRIRFREAMERYFLMVPDFWALTRQSQTTHSDLHHTSGVSDEE